MFSSGTTKQSIVRGTDCFAQNARNDIEHGLIPSKATAFRCKIKAKVLGMREARDHKMPEVLPTARTIFTNARFGIEIANLW